MEKLYQTIATYLKKQTFSTMGVEWRVANLFVAEAKNKRVYGEAKVFGILVEYVGVTPWRAVLDIVDAEIERELQRDIQEYFNMEALVYVDTDAVTYNKRKDRYKDATDIRESIRQNLLSETAHPRLVKYLTSKVFTTDEDGYWNAISFRLSQASFFEFGEQTVLVGLLDKNSMNKDLYYSDSAIEHISNWLAHISVEYLGLDEVTALCTANDDQYQQMISLLTNSEYTVQIPFKDIDDYVSAARGYLKDVCTSYFTGGYLDNWWDDNSYWQYGWLRLFTPENEAKAWQHICHVLGRTQEDLEEEYGNLEDTVKENEDELNDLIQLVDSCVSDGVMDDYVNHRQNEVLSSLKELGTPTVDWENECIWLKGNFKNFDLEMENLLDYVDACSGDSACVLKECLGRGDIDKPRLSLDDHYEGDCSTKQFNENFAYRAEDLEGVE